MILLRVIYCFFFSFFLTIGSSFLWCAQHVQKLQWKSLNSHKWYLIGSKQPLQGIVRAGLQLVNSN